MSDRIAVFVYGTLMEGQGNHRRIIRDGDIIGSCSAVLDNAEMYNVGAFPAVVESDKGLVSGQCFVFDPNKYDSLLEKFDQLEGYREHAPETSMYIRKRKKVFTELGKHIDAYVYFWNNSTDRMDPIESGSWRQYLIEKIGNIS